MKHSWIINDPGNALFIPFSGAGFASDNFGSSDLFGGTSCGLKLNLVFWTIHLINMFFYFTNDSYSMQVSFSCIVCHQDWLNPSKIESYMAEKRQ
jgi:hypothetical protein